jgi:hypothetical protein
MGDSWAEVDMSNQIDNSWNKDSCLASKKGEEGFTVKIRLDDKKSLKKKFIWDEGSDKNKKHNRRVIVIIYCFMLHKLLVESNNLGNKFKLCNDAGPRWSVLKYLDAIFRYYGELPIGQKFKIKFRVDGDLESLAHNLAKKTMKGRKKEDYIINTNDIKELEDIIRKII